MSTRVMKPFWRQRAALWTAWHKITGHHMQDVSVDGLGRHWSCRDCGWLEWRGD